MVTEHFTNMLGTVAGICTTISFVPQVAHVFRTRSVQDISAGMYTLLTVGLLLWIGYGAILRAYPIIISNTISLVCVVAILAMKLLWERPRSTRRS